MILVCRIQPSVGILGTARNFSNESFPNISLSPTITSHVSVGRSQGRNQQNWASHLLLTAKCHLLLTTNLKAKCHLQRQIWRQKCYVLPTVNFKPECHLLLTANLKAKCHLLLTYLKAKIKLLLTIDWSLLIWRPKAYFY